MLKTAVIAAFLLFQQAPVTFTGIEHIQGTDSMNVSVRMKYELFLRDYQQTIFDDLDLDLLRSFKPFPDDLANNYLNSKINIEANRKPVIGKLLNMEIDKDDIIFRLLYRVDRKLKFLTIKNTMLNGLFSNAENLIIVNSRGNESEMKLSPEHNQETFQFK